MKKELTFTGKITNGSKIGKKFVSLTWVKKQIKEKLGFIPYPGTLNLILKDKSIISKLRDSEGIRILPEPGYCEGKCFKALILDKIKGAVVLPEVPKYPNDLMEILSSTNFRKKLNLNDGDEITVTVILDTKI